MNDIVCNGNIDHRYSYEGIRAIFINWFHHKMKLLWVSHDKINFLSNYCSWLMQFLRLFFFFCFFFCHSNFNTQYVCRSQLIVRVRRRLLWNLQIASIHINLMMVNYHHHYYRCIIIRFTVHDIYWWFLCLCHCSVPGSNFIELTSSDKCTKRHCSCYDHYRDSIDSTEQGGN